MKNSFRWLFSDQRKLIAHKAAQGSGAQETMLMPDYRLARRLGKMVYLPRDVFISSDPAIVSQVLYEQKDDFTSGDAYQFLAPYLGKRSVFVLDKDPHKMAKRDVIRTISRTVNFDELRLETVQDDIAELLQDGAYPVLPMIQQISARIIFDALFPDQPRETRNKVIRAAVENLANVTGGILLFPSFFPKHDERMARIRNNRATVLRFVHSKLGRAAADTIDLPGVEKLGKNATIDNLITLFIAGFETTAASISWGLLALSENPSDQEALHRASGAKYVRQRYVFAICECDRHKTSPFFDRAFAPLPDSSVHIASG